jgi:hypothetical protein
MLDGSGVKAMPGSIPTPNSDSFLKNKKIQVAKWGTPKKYFKKNIVTDCTDKAKKTLFSPLPPLYCPDSKALSISLLIYEVKTSIQSLFLSKKRLIPNLSFLHV